MYKRSTGAGSAGPHVYCLVRKMESDEEVLHACAAIVVADALLEKPKRKRKKWVNDCVEKDDERELWRFIN